MTNTFIIIFRALQHDPKKKKVAIITFPSTVNPPAMRTKKNKTSGRWRGKQREGVNETSKFIAASSKAHIQQTAS